MSASPDVAGSVALRSNSNNGGSSTLEKPPLTTYSNDHDFQFSNFGVENKHGMKFSEGKENNSQTLKTLVQGIQTISIKRLERKSRVVQSNEFLIDALPPPDMQSPFHPNASQIIASPFAKSNERNLK